MQGGKPTSTVKGEHFLLQFIKFHRDARCRASMTSVAVSNARCGDASLP